MAERSGSRESGLVESPHFLAAHSEIVALGAARRVRKGRRERELALKVYVRAKRPSPEFPIPSTLRIAGIGEIPIDVEGIGSFRLESGLGWARPVHPGLGIGCAGSRQTGTLGCLVKRNDETDDNTYVLTCAHCLSDTQPPLDAAHVYQPSPSYMGTESCTVAEVFNWIKIHPAGSGQVNTADAAIAQILVPDNELVARIPYLGDIRGMSSTIREGMTVRKVGAVTGLTTAIVRDAHLHIAITDYRDSNGAYMTAEFSNLVRCDRFAVDGDSGSAVLDEDNRVVGLHMGSSDSSSVFCRMSVVASAFGIRII